MNMAVETTTTEIESLGDFLRKHRQEKNADIATVSHETRIPVVILRAIETDDAESLPAEVFARGFYSIYAKFLGLDVDTILKRFSDEVVYSANNKQAMAPTPSKMGKKVSPMAEAPPINPLSKIGFVLVLATLLLAVISWYFSWNPASYVSKFLRSFQNNSTIEETTDQKITPTEEQQQPLNDAATPVTEPAQTPLAQSAKPVSQPVAKNSPVAPAAAMQYNLQATFKTPTTVQVSLDGGDTAEYVFGAGHTQLWQAQQTMTLVLPEDTTTHLLLNGILIPLPAALNGHITVSIPDYLIN